MRGKEYERQFRRNHSTLLGVSGARSDRGNLTKTKGSDGFKARLRWIAGKERGRGRLEQKRKKQRGDLQKEGRK